MEFAERIRKVQKKARVVLKRALEEMKQQADKRWKNIEVWKKEDKVMLSIKNLVVEERLVKLTEICSWEDIVKATSFYENSFSSKH